MASLEQPAVGTKMAISPEADEGNFTIDPKIERRIIRKVDLYLMPPLWFLFLVSFVDRFNIGNAKIQGMEKSLQLKGNEYNIAYMVFTLAYIVFGVPSNLVFRRFGPKTLSVMMFAWSIVVICQGLTQSWGGLVACRLLLGVLEAGFVPGCAFLIGSYYKRNEFLKRYAVFFSAAIFAGAFNGLFAAVLSKMHGVGGYEGWRWIFIIEGLISIVTSFFSFFFIMPFPKDNKLFTPEEKQVLLQRVGDDGAKAAQSKPQVLDALRDWKVWLGTIAYIGAEENAASIAGFQPTVLKGLGYTATSANIHSIPIYMVAVCISISAAYLSERLRQRYVFAMFGAALSIVANAIEIAQPKHVGVRYAGMFFLTAGPYTIMPILVVWLAINVSKGYKGAVALGTIIPVGNAGALVASNVFLTRETPKFHTGFSVGMGFTCLCIVATTALYVGLRMENRKRDLYQREPHETESVGEKDPDFRYAL